MMIDAVLPTDPQQLFVLAVTSHQAGDLDRAVALYRQVIARRPDDAAPYVNLGIALQGLDRMDGAVAAYRQAIARQPQAAAAYGNLGCALLALGHPEAAMVVLRQAAMLDPQSAEIHNALGGALAARGRPNAAIAAYRRAVVLGPSHGQPYNNLGAALVDAGAFADAVAACRHAMALHPDNAEAENNLANALMGLGLIDEAVAGFRRALRLRPYFPQASTNLSGALIDDGRAGEAIAHCRSAIAVEPQFADAYNNLGNALRMEGRLDEALAAFRRALALAPDDAEIHFNVSAILLKQGFLREGWVEYEWRKRTPLSAFRRNTFPQPEWDGSPLGSRTVLLYAEQGLGDVLQFVRFAPLAAASGRVVLRVYPSLVRLLASIPGVAQVISSEDPLPEFDCHLPLMSLPKVMGVGLAEIPAQVPYLHPDAEDLAAWAARLAGLDGLKVGLVWAGDPRPDEPGANRMDRRRSMALDQLSELAGIPGITLVSLQKGAASRQVQHPSVGMHLVDYMDEVRDFADTAALIANLDLVISVDTSVAHLAGALGRPVWILSRLDGCWRWLDGREDSPWYPTARLFHQTHWGDWSPAVSRLAEALKRLVT